MMLKANQISKKLFSTNKLIYIFSLVLSMSIITSCSEDEKDYSKISYKLMGDGYGFGQSIFLCPFSSHIKQRPS